ncbi:MAG TPA: hypothetical protein VGM90_31320 [Kofleriaceae bacterium]|jgi:DNA-binding beta-propeller fold protein YncE
MKTSILGASLLIATAACGGSSDDCAPGQVCVWAGVGEPGFNNTKPDADRLESKFYFPEDVTFGSDGQGYISDWNNHRIRKVALNGKTTTIVGTDYEGDGPPDETDRLPLCNPPGAQGTLVAMNHPTDVEFGPDGKLYIAAWHNNKIRVWDPETKILTAMAGDSYGFSGDDGPACKAVFNQPKSIVFDDAGNLYTIDQRNLRIRVISPDGTITTMAGTGVQGNLGDGGLALDAQFGFDKGTTPQPTGSLVIKDREMYVADTLNNRIRRINLDTHAIDCIAGNSAAAGYTGDGGPAIDATLNYPNDMEIGPDGRLYIAERFNHTIRAIDLTTGIIDTVVGTGEACDLKDGECPVGDPLTTRLNEPYGVAFDPTGNMYIADTHNHRFLEVMK